MTAGSCLASTVNPLTSISQGKELMVRWLGSVHFVIELTDAKRRSDQLRLFATGACGDTKLIAQIGHCHVRLR